MTLLTDHLRLGPVIFEGRTYSPQVVTRQIDLVASFLDRKCVARSPIVYLVATNHIKTVAAYFGIIKSGRVCLLVDPGTKRLEWAEMTRDAPPGAIIRFDESTDVFELEHEVTLCRGELDSEALAELEGVCTMVFTAAEDGYAKAALLTHENMLANARSLVECGDVDETTPCCGLIPFYHLFALQTGLVTPAVCGAPVCILNPEQLTRAGQGVAELRAAGVARLYSIPALFYLLAMAWTPANAEALPSVLISGGAKLPRSVLERYRKSFEKEIHEGYGLTEAAPICTWHRPMDQIRPDSVGRALTCCELRIEDDSGKSLPVGAVGDVCVGGANVMKGYFRQPEANSRVLRGGWLRTGDLGRLDDDGFLYLTGLKKRMVNVGGKKVYPAEVERMMRTHENVEGALIFGKPQELQGQVVWGRVKLRKKGPQAEKAFRDWCLENISGFKSPSRIVFA